MKLNYLRKKQILIFCLFKCLIAEKAKQNKNVFTIKKLLFRTLNTTYGITNII